MPLIASYFLALPLALASIEQPKGVRVEVLKVEAKTLSTVLTYPARVVPKVNAAVLSESEGVVTEIVAPLGTAVRPGAGRSL